MSNLFQSQTDAEVSGRHVATSRDADGEPIFKFHRGRDEQRHPDAGVTVPDPNRPGRVIDFIWPVLVVFACLATALIAAGGAL